METLPKEIKTIITDCYPYIKEFNPAQKHVIDSGYLKNKENYVIIVPTASGKTILGVIAALETVLKGGKAVYAVPLISIQNEKIKEFKKFEDHGIKVGKHPNSADLSVMIFESFDAFTRFSWDTLRDVDTIIIDEFHMIGDFSRGPTLECAITRAKIINPQIRIVALSATIQNKEEIEAWLEAKTVEHNYRPVPLNKEVLNTENFNTNNKNEVIVKIMEKSIKNNSQSLSFVSTRLYTESLAKYVSEKIKQKITNNQRKKFKKVAETILDVPKKKGSNPTSTCLKLATSAENGAVFHHAGLFNEQKKIIEEEFRAGNLLMIVATPSLMYGVNLPSKSVIIRDYTRWTSQGPQPIPVFDYEQMSGRAGRPQYDNVGFSYLIAKSSDESHDLQEKYVHGEVEEINSKLIENKDAIYKQIISQVASNLSRTPKEIQDFFKMTFYGYQMNNNPSMALFADESLKIEIESALEFLLQNKILQATPSGLNATPHGKLIAKSNYTVETAVKLKDYANQTDEIEVNKLIYHLSSCPDLPLISFKSRKTKDPVQEKMSQKKLFTVNTGNPEATTIALIEWINEKNEYEIENAYNVYSASTRRSAYEASLLVKFLKKIFETNNKYNFSKDLDYLSARLYYGVKKDLIPLVIGLKHLGRKRARTLVNTFGEDLKPISEKQLQKIEGIGSKLAKTIKTFTEHK